MHRRQVSSHYAVQVSSPEKEFARVPSDWIIYLKCPLLV
jgi:hypothetical protein